jgi:hypothetical protein
MAIYGTYYLDLSVDNNPGFALNDPTKPMGFYDWVNGITSHPYYYTNPSNGGQGWDVYVFYAKGTRDISGNSSILQGMQCIIRPWNLALYGPWRLKVYSINNIGTYQGGSTISMCDFRGGIFEVSSNFSSSNSRNMIFSNMFVRTPGYFDFYIYSGNRPKLWLEGSTLVCGTFRADSGTTYMKDSIISAGTLTTTGGLGGTNSGASWSIDTCTFNLAGFNSISGTTYALNHNCQFGWTPPTWPAFTDPASSFKAATLTAGVSAGVLPGITPYTSYQNGVGPGTDCNSYNKDLFGNARTTIGGVNDFVPSYLKIRGKQFQGFSITKDLLNSNVAGNGFTLDVDNSIKVKTVTNSGLVAGGSGLYVDYIKEVPSGAVNGINTTFTLSFTPVANTDQIFLNGIYQESGVNNDYTLSGKTITYAVAPKSGSIILAVYYVANRS